MKTILIYIFCCLCCVFIVISLFGGFIYSKEQLVYLRELLRKALEYLDKVIREGAVDKSDSN